MQIELLNAHPGKVYGRERLEAKMEPVHVTSIVILWVTLMSSLRFCAAVAFVLSPLASAGMRITKEDLRYPAAAQEWVQAFHRVHVEAHHALSRPWALVLMLSGMSMMAGGYSAWASGDLLSTAFDRVAPQSHYFDWLASVLGCLGMAIGLAGISPRPSLSILISIGFAAMGFGIGCISLTYF